MFGVFRVKNHDFTQKNHIFPILEGARDGCAPPPPGSVPGVDISPGGLLVPESITRPAVSV